MRLHKLYRILLGTICLCLLSVSMTEATFAVPETPLDLVIVIDNSASTRETDTHELRYTAAKMLIDLVSDKDRIGIVTFSDDAQALTEFLRLMDTQSARDTFKQIVDDARESDGETNYTRALEETFKLLDVDAGNKRAVIFLTDGEPTVMKEGINLELIRFRSEGIPIFLMLLADTGDPEINAQFENTGAKRINVQSAAEIGRAFASVLTQLQPTIYLDDLYGIPSNAPGTLRFNVEASAVQKISDVRFVFVPTAAADNLLVTEVSKPDNGRLLEIPTDADYAVFSYISSNALPIEGRWAFDSNTEPVISFALIRSDIHLDLIFPPSPEQSGTHTAVANKPLLIGATVGSDDIANAAFVATVRDDDQCSHVNSPADKSESFLLRQQGLATDASLFWNAVDYGNNDAFTIVLALSQLDKPLRLSSCFAVQSVSAIPDAIIINRPTSLNSYETTIPLEIQLSPEVDWDRVTTFITSPDGHVAEVALSSSEDNIWRAVFRGLDSPGDYFLRVVAEGTHSSQNRIAIYEEKLHEVIGSVTLSEPIIDLGKLDGLDTKLAALPSLNVQFAQLDPNSVTFSIVSIQNDDLDQDASSDIKVAFCPSPEIDAEELVCEVTLTPANDLAPGNYVIEVEVNVPGQNLTENRVQIKFYRPESFLQIIDKALPFWVTPATPVVTQTINFTPTLWQGDPLLSTQLNIQEIRDVTQQKTLSLDLIELELKPIRFPGALEYELILKTDENLPEGSYEVTAKLTTQQQNLQIKPDVLVIPIKKQGAFITAEFSDAPVVYKQPLWGILILPRILPQLFNTADYLQIPINTYYMDELPELPLPEVVQIKRNNANETVNDVETVIFMWRNDGRKEGSSNTHDSSLIINLIKPLPGGSYDVRLQLPPPFQSPLEQSVRITVYGYKEFALHFLLPLVVILLITQIIYRLMFPKCRGSLIFWGYEWPLSEQKDWPTVFNLSLIGGTGKISVNCVGKDKIEIVIGTSVTRLKRGGIHPEFPGIEFL